MILNNQVMAKYSWQRLFLFIIFLAQRTSSKPSGNSAKKANIDVKMGYTFRAPDDTGLRKTAILSHNGKWFTIPIPKPEVHQVEGYLSNIETQIEGHSDASKYSNKALAAHNRYRNLYHAPPLRWSPQLALQAQMLAYSLARGESPDPWNGDKRGDVTESIRFGENIEKIIEDRNVKKDCETAGEEATNRWFEQHLNFTFSDVKLREKTNSFTQLVWKDTSELGMGCARKKGLLQSVLYVVALYNPPGNVPGKERVNVLRPGNKHLDVYATVFKKGTVADG